METYQVNPYTIIVETNSFIYYLWDIDQHEIILDKFKLEDSELIYAGVLPPSKKNSEPNEEHIELMRGDYQERAKFPRVDIHQYLTSENKKVREAIRKIIDGSI